ncbi:hypothetical protein DERP_008246 [Dermatophagoides pteronyssinus]|uniref:Uncharacterized protein n=1 Tax=Dermatophagoides pteronyssinus TaxID=6956 RepID=A0ABQ8J636_DERPT|nr:hypothetical protein DERP_008246 [Dermatophagoides pteronyssinus]
MLKSQNCLVTRLNIIAMCIYLNRYKYQQQQQQKNNVKSIHSTNMKVGKFFFCKQVLLTPLLLLYDT